MQAIIDLWQAAVHSPVWSWALSVVLSGSLSASLVILAGVLGRSQLSHWLNKDLEVLKKRHQQELEAAKSQHAHELEAYKVLLIAETERVKASQDVRKAMALKIAEKRFAAFEALHSAMLNCGTSKVISRIQVVVKAGSSPQERAQLKSELVSEIFKISTAISAANPFLKLTEIAELSQYVVNSSGFTAHIHSVTLPANFEAIAKQLVLEEIGCQKIVHKYLDQMLAMENPVV